MEKVIHQIKKSEVVGGERTAAGKQQGPESDKLFIRFVYLSQVFALLTVLVGLLFIAWVEYPRLFAPQAEPVEAVVSAAVEEVDEDRVENGMDVASGLVAEGEYLMVKRSCTACHSGKLVTQNRATREGWLEMIRWMQETQKLWDLGPGEDKILDYLAKYYGPQKKGRRTPLAVEEWYMIE